MKNTITIRLIFLIYILTLSQGILCTNKKVQPKYNKTLILADIAYEDSKYSIAAEYFETYLKVPANSAKEILLKLADCYWQMRKYDNALQVYNLIYIEMNQLASEQDKLRIAELYARNGEYKKAAEWLNGVQGYQMKTNIYNSLDSINALKKDSLNWKLDYLNVNTSYREFSPTIANNTLFFSSNKPLSTKAKANGWDGDNFAHLWEIPMSNVDSIPSFYQIDLKTSTTKTLENKNLAGIFDCGDNKSMDKIYHKFIKESSVKADLKPIGKPITGLDKFKFNAGAIAFDRNNHIYFSANYPKADKKGINRLCLMEGLYSSSSISNIHKLPFGDANFYSVMHPAVNPEGTILVCTSDKNGGKGNFDLYYSLRNDINQPWDTLKAFSKNINTVGNEVFPSITANGFLYFSSDNIPGLGGLDIFRIPLKDAISGKGKIEHISYPVNSSADDFGWTEQDSTGLKGFFTSDRLNYNDNIYSFTYVPVKLPKLPKKSFIDGYVLEKQSLKSIIGATVFLYNISEDTVYIAKADQNGKYHFPVLTTSKVIIKAVDKKYLSDCLTSNLVYEPQPKDTIQNAPRNLLLDKFKVGFVWKLSNIHYDFNKWNIRPDAMPILDSLIMVLNEQPITVELGSHTDSRGSTKYNEKLSQHRAESAVAYLIQHGINSKRITAKGYGESQLLNRCSDGVPCSEEEHQANRRTEVKVTGYTTPQKVTININPDKYMNGQIVKVSSLPPKFFDDCK